MESNKMQIDSEKDHMLQFFVNLANQSAGSLSFGITLVTHGFLVSGMLIGGNDYFKGLAEETSQMPEGFENLGNTFKKAIEKMGEDTYGEEDKISSNPTFIHLKNARFYTTNGNPLPANRGVWWRGRLTEISGFSLGLLS